MGKGKTMSGFETGITDLARNHDAYFAESTMREIGIASAFTFDDHFAEQGFTVVPVQER
jgi:hypothetical protein